MNLTLAIRGGDGQPVSILVAIVAFAIVAIAIFVAKLIWNLLLRSKRNGDSSGPTPSSPSIDSTYDLADDSESERIDIPSPSMPSPPQETEHRNRHDVTAAEVSKNNVDESDPISWPLFYFGIAIWAAILSFFVLG